MLFCGCRREKDLTILHVIFQEDVHVIQHHHIYFLQAHFQKHGSPWPSFSLNRSSKHATHFPGSSIVVLLEKEWKSLAEML